MSMTKQQIFDKLAVFENIDYSVVTNFGKEGTTSV